MIRIRRIIANDCNIDFNDKSDIESFRESLKRELKAKYILFEYDE
jgi:hypothetical protein